MEVAAQSEDEDEGIRLDHVATGAGAPTVAGVHGHWRHLRAGGPSRACRRPSGREVGRPKMRGEAPMRGSLLDPGDLRVARHRE